MIRQCFGKFHGYYFQLLEGSAYYNVKVEYRDSGMRDGVERGEEEAAGRVCSPSSLFI